MADADIIRCTGCRMDHRADNFELDRLGRRRKTCLSCKAKREARKHLCDRCDAAFGLKNDLNSHIRTAHEKRRDFKCDQCDASFGAKCNLDTHIRTVHEKRRDFHCDQCDASFGLKHHLDTHIRMVHEKRRDFKCDQCDKAFGQKGDLDKHVREVHEKRRDFKCDQCDASFGRKGNLDAHAGICTGELTRCSGGELACMKALDAMGLTYTRDQTHEGLTGETGQYLRFDFVVEWKTAELVIEYDGQQHFKPVCFGGISQESAQTSFEKLQRHDKLKDDYCASKGIPLLRIPYTKFGEIPQLVTDFIVGNTDWGAEPEKQELRSTLTDDELCAVLADFGF